MVNYKCFYCGKQTSNKNLEKRFICPDCGSKVFFKPRKNEVTLKAI